jgi:hypothetical protein
LAVVERSISVFHNNQEPARDAAGDTDADRVVGYERLTNRKRTRRFEDQRAKLILTMPKRIRSLNSIDDHALELIGHQPNLGPSPSRTGASPLAPGSSFGEAPRQVILPSNIAAFSAVPITGSPMRWPRPRPLPASCQHAPSAPSYTGPAAPPSGGHFSGYATIIGAGTKNAAAHSLVSKCLRSLSASDSRGTASCFCDDAGQPLL